MISNANAHAKVRITLKSRGFKRVGIEAADYEGQISVHGKPVDIRLSVPDIRFVEMPVVNLLDRSQVPVESLAHLEPQNKICYKSSVGLPLDMYKPDQAVLLVLNEVKRTLELSYAGRGPNEISDEFQLHWPSSQFVGSLLLKRQCSPIFRVSWYRFRNDHHEFDALAASATLATYSGSIVKGVTVCVACEPLKDIPGQVAPSTLLELQKWVMEQPGLQHLQWQTCVSDFAANRAVFVWAENAFIGFKAIFPADLATLKKKARPKPRTLEIALSKRSATIKIERISVSKIDIDTVTNRGGAMATTLAGKQIALIGCGTIGGYLARMLAQSGAGTGEGGSLLVVDNQSLSEGNIGRHMLGFSDILKSKAKATAAELKRFHPQLNVVAVDGDALKHWKQISQCELVVDATGDWNTQNAINELFLEGGKPVQAVLHAWVYMNGAGVQSFLNLRDDRACFRCLKPDLEKNWRYPAAVASTEIDIQPASCTDGAFVPFPVDAPVTAAALANRMALEWVAGKPGPRLRTIKIDLERGQAHKPVSPEPASTCPACKDLREKK